MRIRIESSGGDARALHATAERRLRFALRRLAWLVSCATVRIAGGGAAPAPRRCRVELQTHAGETIAVSAIARDEATALETALARAGRHLARAWARTLDREGRGNAGSLRPRGNAKIKRAVVGHGSPRAPRGVDSHREAHADA